MNETWVPGVALSLIIFGTQDKSLMIFGSSVSLSEMKGFKWAISQDSFSAKTFHINLKMIHIDFSQISISNGIITYMQSKKQEGIHACYQWEICLTQGRLLRQHLPKALWSSTFHCQEDRSIPKQLPAEIYLLNTLRSRGSCGQIHLGNAIPSQRSTVHINVLNALRSYALKNTHSVQHFSNFI